MLVYIQRDIDAALIAWKTEWNRKPLLLRRVRQCGKTSAVRHFADQFENYVEINFEENERYQVIFDRDFVVRRILAALNWRQENEFFHARHCCFWMKSRHAQEPLQPFAISMKNCLNYM